MRLAVSNDMDTIDNYIQLASHIVRMVAQDYVNACIGLQKHPDSWRLKAKRDECLWFFHSKNFEAFSLGANPDYTIRLLDEMAERGERVHANIGAKHELPKGVDDEYTMTDEEYANWFPKL